VLLPRLTKGKHKVSISYLGSSTCKSKTKTYSIRSK
jgi:hypothetical protein